MSAMSFSQNWKTYTKNDGLSGDSILFITGDSQNNIWASIYQKGVMKYDGNGWQTYNKENSGLKSNNIFKIMFDKNDNPWFSTADKNFQLSGISTLKNNQWITYDSTNSPIKHSAAKHAAFDDFGNVWITTVDGIVRIDNNGIFKSYNSTNSNLSDDWTNEILIDKDSSFWVGKEDGLAYFDKGSFTNYSTYGYGVSHLIKDKLNNVCFTSSFTQYDDIVELGNNNFVQYSNIYDTINDLNIKQIQIDKDNSKWVGTSELGLMVFSKNGLKFYNTQNSGILDNSVLSHFIDKNGDVWIATLKGISRFSTSSILGLESEMKVFKPYKLINKTIYFDKLNELKIFNLMGKCIYSGNTSEINIDSFISGIYIIEIDKSEMYKVFIQN